MQITDAMAIALFGVLLALVFVWRRGRDKRVPPAPRKRIVLDGTNVLFWHDNTAKLATLQKVVRALHMRGYDPLVFLDASSRHHIGDRTLGEAQFATALNVPPSHVRVCPKGTEADAYLLSYAQEHGLRVVSNDRFRDRPHAARNVPLVKGRFEGERLVLKNL